MLPELVVRILAILMAALTVAGILSFARRGAHAVGGHPRRPRAVDNPPPSVQKAWQAVVFLPQLYPFLVAAVPAVAYGTMVHFAFPFDAAVQVAAFLVWGAGGLLVLWSGRTLGRFMVIDIVVSDDHEIVTAGPYAWIRHPTYTGTILMAFGVAFTFLSWVLLALAFATVAIASYRARKEERLLASDAALGEAYRAYAARTGRFLPRLGR